MKTIIRNSIITSVNHQGYLFNVSISQKGVTFTHVNKTLKTRYTRILDWDSLVARFKEQEYETIEQRNKERRENELNKETKEKMKEMKQ
jgi:hypothetical protein